MNRALISPPWRGMSVACWTPPRGSLSAKRCLMIYRGCIGMIINVDTGRGIVMELKNLNFDGIVSQGVV